MAVRRCKQCVSDGRTSVGEQKETKGKKKGKEICEDSVEDASGEETDDGDDGVKALISEEVRGEAKRLLARWKDTKVNAEGRAGRGQRSLSRGTG